MAAFTVAACACRHLVLDPRRSALDAGHDVLGRGSHQFGVDRSAAPHAFGAVPFEDDLESGGSAEVALGSGHDPRLGGAGGIVAVVAVLVDDAIWPFDGRLWAHMISDVSFEELHEFAGALGIPRRGFQGDHYDVPTEYRARAIELGAIPVGSRELVRRLRAAGLRRVRTAPSADAYDRFMARITLFHNPKCSTSRKVDEALTAAGVGHDTVLYLKDAPSRSDLERIIGHLDDPVADLVRKDKRFGELGLDAADYTTADAVIALLLEHPELMQRPILETADRAAIGRPPEEVVATFL